MQEKLDHITISIHSLVKRETNTVSNPVSDFKNFNPLPRKEGDLQTQ